MGPSIHAVSSVSCFSNGPRRIVRARLYTTLGGSPPGRGVQEKGAADIFLETERKDLVVFTPEERKRAVELYLTTSTTTAEAVEHLGHPTRRRLERRPAKDPRYVGHMAKPIIPWKPGGRRSNRYRAACAEASRPAARRGRERRGPLGQGASRGRHGRVAAQERERRAGRRDTVEAAAR